MGSFCLELYRIRVKWPNSRQVKYQSASGPCCIAASCRFWIHPPAETTLKFCSGIWIVYFTPHEYYLSQTCPLGVLFLSISFSAFFI